MARRTAARAAAADAATEYARAVLAGSEPANEHVRHACQRHLDDLRRADRGEAPWRWEPQHGEHFAAWWAANIRHEDGGPVALLPWQRYLTGALLGWRMLPGDPDRRIPGTRRFRGLYLETGKGSGKTALCAAIDLYLMTQDYYFDRRGRWVPVRKMLIAVCASRKEQARDTAMAAAKQFVLAQPEFTTGPPAIEIRGGETDPMLYCGMTNSRMESFPTTRQGRGTAGLITSVVHAEELHEYPSLDHYHALVAGFKTSPQPLAMIATNAGIGQFGFAWEQHQHAVRTARGEGTDRELALVYGVDDADIPSITSKARWYPPRKTWRRANPSLGTTIGEDYIVDQIQRTAGMIGRENVRRLNFCSWKAISASFMAFADWDAACTDALPDIPEGAPLHLGLDLSASRDMTALACLWQVEDMRYARVIYYTAEEGIEDRSQASSGLLLDWLRAGHLTGCPGKQIDYAMPIAEIARLSDRYAVQGIAYDPYGITEFVRELERQGVPHFREHEVARPDMEGGLRMVQHPQTNRGGDEGALRPHTSIAAMEARILGSAETGPQLTIERNPVLNWNLACAYLRTSIDGRRMWNKVDSQKSGGKIDGLVALSQACGLADRAASSTMRTASPYDDPAYSWRGVLAGDGPPRGDDDGELADNAVAEADPRR